MNFKPILVCFLLLFAVSACKRKDKYAEVRAVLEQVLADDQKFRNPYIPEKQNPLDRKNKEIVTKIIGKLSRNIKDSKKIWYELKKEITKDFILRKANEEELKYYWATISFDIEEPLYILERSPIYSEFIQKKSKIILD